LHEGCCNKPYSYRPVDTTATDYLPQGGRAGYFRPQVIGELQQR